MKLTILISSAGRRVELINCFRADAKALGLELRVLAADANPAMSAACAAADGQFLVPRCDAKDYIACLLKIAETERVNLIVPTIDPELLPLAGARDKFELTGTRVVVSALEMVALARDKLRTARFLTQQGIPSPRSIPLRDLLHGTADLQFPVILKRVDGSSSIGVHEAKDLTGVVKLNLDVHNYLAQEKWFGREYTVNVFFDRGCRLRAAVPHLRVETRAGEVSKGRTERLSQLMDLAERLGAALAGAAGPLCFQSIVTAEGKAMIFEINARFGGGFPLAHRAGAAFSRWLLEEAAGLPSSASGDWQEGLTMLRYDSAVFLPPAKP